MIGEKQIMKERKKQTKMLQRCASNETKDDIDYWWFVNYPTHAKHIGYEFIFCYLKIIGRKDYSLGSFFYAQDAGGITIVDEGDWILIKFMGQYLAIINHGSKEKPLVSGKLCLSCTYRRDTSSIDYSGSIGTCVQLCCNFMRIS